MEKQGSYRCLPGAYVCEHQVINPFVGYLNVAKGSAYVHLGCPDKVERTQPAPDALYGDQKTGKLLVIEHKSLVWPPFFGERHRNDHRLMDRLCTLLGPDIANEPFVLELPYLLNASWPNIEAFARQIRDAAEAHKHVLLDGGSISGTCAARYWQLRMRDLFLQPDSQGGMTFSWNLLDPKAYRSQHEPRSRVLQVLCASAAKKFVHYAEASRILLLELTGHIESLLSSNLLDGCTVPDAINEVWTAYFERFENGEEDWVYDLKWPVLDA